MVRENRVTFDELFGGTLFYRLSGGRFVKLRAKLKIGTVGPYVNAVRLRDGDLILIPDKEKVEISRLPWE